MATFNIGEITTATTIEADSGRRLTVAEGGVVRGRNTYAVPVYTIRFVIMTDLAGVGSIETFYNTYSTVFNEATIDGVAYTWLFSNKPMTTLKEGNMRTVEFEAVGYTV